MHVELLVGFSLQRTRDAMLLPEHTVDSLISVEFVRRIPEALIWCPSQFAGSYDHFIAGIHHFVILEAKGIRDNETVLIAVPQLVDHVATGLPVHYVLPASDQTVTTARLCNCTDCLLNGGRCLHCVRDIRSVRTSAIARRLPIVPNVRGAPTTAIQNRIAQSQSWFGHWTWIVPAQSLLTQVQTWRATRVPPPTLIPTSAEDGNLAKILRAVRLCKFLDEASRSLAVSRTQTIDGWEMVRTGDDVERNRRMDLIASFPNQLQLISI
jgi:hypothetical protein